MGLLQPLALFQTLQAEREVRQHCKLVRTGSNSTVPLMDYFSCFWFSRQDFPETLKRLHFYINQTKTVPGLPSYRPPWLTTEVVSQGRITLAARALPPEPLPGLQLH